MFVKYTFQSLLSKKNYDDYIVLTKLISSKCIQLKMQIIDNQKLWQTLF